MEPSNPFATHPKAEQPNIDPIWERFWDKAKRAENGCLEWTGALTGDGYGKILIDGKARLAHRVAWEMIHGAIPEGLHLDHLCRNRACVDPAHLEPVTPRENALRGESQPAINARKTHCKRGHEFTNENTKTVTRADGRTVRACLACRRWRNEERKRERARSYAYRHPELQ